MPETSSSPNRRQFLSTTAKVGAMAVAMPGIIIRQSAFAANSDTLKVGLVGCGGRGTGAAGNALTADSNCVLTAMGDVFPDQLENSYKGLKEQFDKRIAVTPDTKFTGLDAFKKVIDSDIDVVLLATPPGFRPTHLRYAVEKGRQIFCEKPLATDASGIRHALESVRMAKAKNLNLVAGFCWRSDLPRRALYQQIHAGAIGDIRSVYGTYLTGPVKPMQAPSARKDGVTDLEWQLRNWMNFSWLAGDGIVEQCIHTVDKLAWCMKDVPPIKCTATGGRMVGNFQGNIFDHMTVVYEYANGVRATIAQRQIAGCYNDNSDYIMGTTGHALSGWNTPVIRGEKPWKYQGKAPDMYVVEHEELFAGIRGNGPIRNDGEWLASSTLQGLMARTAAYTGLEVTWENMLNSKEKLGPTDVTWDMSLPIMGIPIPGQYRLS